MASSNASRAKQKAAEARAAAEAAEKRRKRLVNIAIFSVLGLVVLGLVGGAYVSSRSNKEQLQPNAEAAIPAGAYPASDADYKYGVPLGKAATGSPVLQIWEDFQCPGCASFEKAFRPTVEQLAADGDATVIWRSTSFLDARYPGDNSKRAAAAWGCAIDAGKGKEFHDLVFDNQPATEGQGYTDAQLSSFAEQAGITGEAKTKWDKCVADKTYLQWAINGTQTMTDNGVPSTPGVYLDGKQLSGQELSDPAALKQTVLDAAKSQQN
jgi:protein-disulfide isomerase